MKRIKHDEIQNSIKNYVKQRNLSTSLTQMNQSTNEADASRKNKSSTGSSHQNLNRKQLTAGRAHSSLDDLNIMALNDLVLIESSINDYYSYSFNSTSDQDYLKQFQT